MLRRVAVLLALVVATLVVPAGPASAHVGAGPSPTNWAAAIVSVQPRPDGVGVSLSPDGEELTVSSTADELTVPGYSDEPYLRIGPGGVQRNANSPATYLNLTAEGDSALPARADPTAAPHWVDVSPASSYTWHDHRTHWMGSAPPPEVQANAGQEHLISRWQVPLIHGGSTVTVSGTLRWVPPPPSLPWTLSVAVLLVLGVAAGGRRHWAPPMLGLLGVVVAAELAHLATGRWPEEDAVFAVVSSAVPAAAAVILAIVAVRSVRAGTASAPYAAGLAGLVLSIQGLSDVSGFWNSQLPVAGPDWLARCAVTVTIGLGAGVSLGSLRVLRRAGVLTGDATSPGVAAAG